MTAPDETDKDNQTGNGVKTETIDHEKLNDTIDTDSIKDVKNMHIGNVRVKFVDTHDKHEDESQDKEGESEDDEDDDDEGDALDMGDVLSPEAAALLKIKKTQSNEWFPDGGFGWAVVVGAFIIHIFIGGFMKSSGVMYIKLKDKFNQSAVATAWVFSLFTTFLLMMGPVASALCHRFSCRTVVFWGGLLCCIGIVMSAFAPNIEFLYFSYCVVGGFGRCLTYTPSLIIVTSYFNKRRGLAVGVATAGVGLGMFSFPPLLEVLFGTYGYQGAMLLLAAISLESLVCAALFRPLDLHKKIAKTKRINDLVHMARRGSIDARKHVLELTGGARPRNKNLDDAKGENWHGSNSFSSTTEFTFVVPEPRRKSVFYDKVSRLKQTFKKSSPGDKKVPFFEFSLLKDLPFLSLCLGIMFFTMSMMSTFVFLPPLAKSKGVTQIQSSYLVSIMGVSDSIARFTSGLILDLKRVKKYRLLVYNGVMFGVAAVSMIMPSLETFYSFAAVSVCYGLLAGTYVAQKSVVVVDVLGVEKMTSSFGLLLGFQGIGSLFGPTISGLFKDIFGTYDEAFYFGGIGMCFGGLVLVCGNIWKIVRDRRMRRRKAKQDSNNDKC